MQMKNRNPLWATSSWERKSYYLYFFGQNMIYVLVTTFLITALLFQGLDVGKAAGVTLLIKIWDAVNDAVFGCIFDKVRFKRGKFIPWLRISLLAIPITTVLLFCMPNFESEKMKLGWYIITYILWDTAYTLCDVPIFGLVTAMAERIDERTALQSYKSLWGSAGGGFATILATVLAGEGIGLNYGIISVVVAVGATLTMAPICKLGKERFVAPQDESFTVRKMFKYLFSNKYLLLYYGGFFFYSSANIVPMLGVFVSYYLFHNSMFSLFVGALSAIPQLVMSLLIPKLVKKVDKMVIFKASALLQVVLGVIMWAVGYNNIWAFIILSVIRSIPQGVTGIMLFMFTPDCAEYGRFKTKIDAKGITFAIQTFVVKLSSAVASALSFALLGVIKWRDVSQAKNFEELAKLNITQGESTLKGLWFIYVMIPTIGVLLGLIIWHFYKLKDRDVEIMTEANNGQITREEALGKIELKDKFEE